MPTLIFSKPTHLKSFQNEYTSAFYWIFFSCAAFFIFLFDLNTPLGVAAGTPYSLIIFGSLWLKGNQSTYIAVLLGISLTVAGFFLSSGIVTSMDVALTNRLLAIIIILATAFMVLKIKKINNTLSQLLTEAYIDSPTQCKGNRAFEAELLTEIKRSKRYDRTLSLAIFDIDNFTQLHPIDKQTALSESDWVVNQLVKEIRSSIRNSDQLYRIGQDRFAVLFVETEIHEAKEICNVLREKISKISHFDKQPDFTISVGITKLQNNDNQYELYQRAEEALLKAKENGKNQVSTQPEITRNGKAPVPAILLRSRANQSGKSLIISQ